MGILGLRDPFLMGFFGVYCFYLMGLIGFRVPLMGLLGFKVSL
jgi:hypothetical protein